ncbi:hypothetical protein RFM41_23175 [Mesorhizobium sp. VK25A]|uniref:DUF6916 domain-containing protein n=1 Tax=Mesorhizobium vachelliae TaxID=3072309 RepID=A0ABU5ABX2_9HYPH|nr:MULTISPECIES: hypothetical protein [unclassified Mesorhizobium]MDX8534102.1 hypothetical protein [Mesorhizobium sp. VK25D]MDX8546671.1 hypothetical protein [Mesorhizobium sp. VK25A]
MEIVTLGHFAGCVGSSFDIDFGQSSVPLTLAEANPLLETGFPGMRRSPFSLIFRSGSQVVLPQKLYKLKNATLGQMEIFLVPVARDKAGIVYQAIFN